MASSSSAIASSGASMTDDRARCDAHPARGFERSFATRRDARGAFGFNYTSQMVDDVLERLAVDFGGFEQKGLLLSLHELGLDGARLLRVGRARLGALELDAVGVLELSAEDVVGDAGKIALRRGFDRGLEIVGSIPVLLVHVLALGGETMAVGLARRRVPRDEERGVGGVAEEFQRLLGDAGLDFDDGGSRCGRRTFRGGS